MNTGLTIGITDCAKWKNYERWILQHDPGIEVIKLTWKENNFSDISKCNGIILSGGEDVHPRFYGKPEYYSLLLPKDITEERDIFELKVIDMAMQANLPVLGICRGLQIANVYFKGTLIPDIATLGKPGHPMIGDEDDAHIVKTEENTLFRKIVESAQGKVNSAHHQSADLVGEELKVNATSEDGIVEGLEWKNPEGKPFLLLVQWHPERMKDADTNSFSINLRNTFLQEASLTAEKTSN